MANSTQILNKIERNLGQRGIATTRNSAELLTVDGLEVSYRAKAAFPTTPNPMLGVDDSSSPYLGIGVAGAGSIQIEDTAQAAADAIDTATRMTLFAEAAGLANDIIVLGTDGAANEIRIAGQSDVLGLGE